MNIDQNICLLRAEKSRVDGIFERERVGPLSLAAKKFRSLRFFKQFVKKKQGFTIFEALIAITVFLLATTVIYEFVRGSLQFQRFSFESERAIASSQRSVEILVKEIREAANSAIGSYPIVSADDTELVVYADYDRDTNIERVRYYLDGTDLKKGVTEPTANPIYYLQENETTTIIAQHIRNSETNTPIFQYYNEDWPGDTEHNPLATPADISQIKMVRIFLRINIIPERAPTDFELQSDVHIRNLKENL